MKTITIILTTIALVAASYVAGAQPNYDIQKNKVDADTLVESSYDSIYENDNPGPMVAPPPTKPNPEEPSIAPNTQPETPGTPHPGTTVDPRLESSGTFQFKQEDFLKSVNNSSPSCDGSSCAVVVSNEK